jgi:hypothetical protein
VVSEVAIEGRWADAELLGDLTHRQLSLLAPRKGGGELAGSDDCRAPACAAAGASGLEAGAGALLAE